MGDRFRVDASDNTHLQAVLTAMELIPDTIRKHNQANMEAAMIPAFQDTVMDFATTVPHATAATRLIGATTTAFATDNNLYGRAPARSAQLSGGLSALDAVRMFEFGSHRDDVKEFYRGGPKRRLHKVKKHTQKQLPHIRSRGWVFYPAVGHIAPRLMKLWWQTTIRTIHEAFEGK